MQSQKQAMSQNELEISAVQKSNDNDRMTGLTSEPSEALKSVSHAAWGLESLKQILNELREAAWKMFHLIASLYIC